MKKLFRVLGITFGVLFVIFFIGFIWLLKSLPSAGEVGQYLKPSNAKTALKALDRKAQPATTTTVPTTDSGSAATAQTTTTAKYNFKAEEDRLLINDMTDERLPLAEVCGNLRYSHKVQLNGYSLKDFGQAYKDSVISSEKDPVIQAIKPSLRYIFRQPQMRGLLTLALESSEKGEDESLMGKAEFYNKAYSAYRELQARQKNVEQIMDRSYQLMILSKVMAKKPLLINDVAVKNYCQDLEAALNNSNPTNYEEERKEFSAFMQESGVDPKEVGYDPNYRTQLSISMGSKTMRMDGGWINDILKPTPSEIEAISEEGRKQGL